MSSGTKDITVILSCQRQGRLLHPSVRSIAEAIAKAESELAVSIEWIFAADQPSEETTEYFRNCLPDGARKIISDSESDQAQFRAVEEAQGRFVSTTSGNDLVSGNWLSKAFLECSVQSANVVFHPAMVVVFGEQQFLYITPDQDSPDFSKDILLARNPWPGTTFGPKEIFLAHRRSNPNIERGFAYPDWHWQCETIADGVLHRPVPGTFSCCRRQGEHRCIVSEAERELLIPQSKLFQVFGSKSEA